LEEESNQLDDQGTWSPCTRLRTWSLVTV
jgi:hypothetical protein